MRGRLKAASIIKLIVLLAHSAAGQRRQKIKNEGDDDQFGFKTPGFSPYLNRDQANLNALHIFIYTLLNAFAKALMLIL
jgi:hypothetical protein